VPNLDQLSHGRKIWSHGEFILDEKRGRLRIKYKESCCAEWGVMMSQMVFY